MPADIRTSLSVLPDGKTAFWNLPRQVTLSAWAHLLSSVKQKKPGSS